MAEEEKTGGEEVKEKAEAAEEKKVEDPKKAAPEKQKAEAEKKDAGEKGGKEPKKGEAMEKKEETGEKKKAEPKKEDESGGKGVKKAEEKAGEKPSEKEGEDVEAAGDEPKESEEVVDEAEDEKQLKKKIKKKEPGRDRRDRDEQELPPWKPKTRLGMQVNSGEITSMRDVMAQPAPIKEVELVDRLLPDMQEEILSVGRVQRVTDSGRRMRFRVVSAVGSGDGYVGVGESKGKEAGPTIRKSIERAKLNIREVKRGCGSWECGCGMPHTVPYKVAGKSGSVTVTLKPAPRGVGIVSGQIAKTIISLAGITDVWVTTEGHSRTAINFAHAVINALENTNYVKVKEGDADNLNIVTGASVKKEAQEEIQ